MVTIEQKLTLFSKLLDQEITDEATKKKASLEEEYERKIAESKAEVDKQAKELINTAKRRAESKRVELISKGKLQSKKERMLMTEEIIQQFIATLKNKIVEFQKTDKYKSYLEERVKDALATEKYENTLEIALTEYDFKTNKDFLKSIFVKLGLKESQLKFKVSDQEILGGFVIEDPTLNMRIDESIEEILEESKDRIVDLVTTAISKDGDLVEE